MLVLALAVILSKIDERLDKRSAPVKPVARAHPQEICNGSGGSDSLIVLEHAHGHGIHA